MEAGYRATPLAPVNRLPPELLSAIFIERLIESVEEAPDFQIPRDEVPDVAIPIALRCSQVCRLWRSVAVCTAFLWSFISVTITSLSEQDEHKCAFLDLWLSRSRSAPLRIYITHVGSSYRHYESDVSLQRLLGLLTAHAHRWRYLFLHLRPEWLRAFAHLDENSAPLLERLQMHDWHSRLLGSYERCTEFDSVRFYTGSPVLQIVTVQSDFHIDRFRLRSLHLTRLQLSLGATWTTGNLSHFRDFFAQICDTLDNCNLSGLPMVWAGTPPPPVIMGCLRHLLLEQYDDDSFGLGPFLKIFTLPSIHRICINADHFPQEDFIAMMRRSAPKLQIFSIGIHDAASVDLLECLREMPYLTELDVDPSHLAMVGAIEAMTPCSSPLLVPGLKTLEVQVDKGVIQDYLFDAAIMVSARWHASKIPMSDGAEKGEGQLSAIDDFRISFESEEDDPDEQIM